MTTLHGLLVDLVPMTRVFSDEKMYEYWNNESRLWATMGDQAPTSKAQIKRIVEERANGRENGYTGVHFMMKARDGNVIGSIGLGWVNEWHRFAWMGAWIGEADYWGGGHGTDALLLTCQYAFDWLDMRRLILVTMGLNERAQRNVEKVGFRLEARQRESTKVNGQAVDGLMYGMLLSEWQGREALVESLQMREKGEKRYGPLD